MPWLSDIDTLAKRVSLTWDITVVTTLADSYTLAYVSSSEDLTTAEMATSRKQAKYAVLSGSHNIFKPIALETLGPITELAVQFLNDLGNRIISVCRWQVWTIPFPTTLYHFAEIQRCLAARVVLEWQLPGPLAIHGHRCSNWTAPMCSILERSNMNIVVDRCFSTWTCFQQDVRDIRDNP